VSITDVALWPTIRDVGRYLDVSAAHVHRLMAAGKLEAVRTRLGWLVNPASVAAYEATRPARKLARSA
jgi:excisionase family DNA binding protein